MKAEHRKELERNALAEGMGRMIRGIREKPQRRSVFIWVGVLVAIVGVVVGYMFWSASKQRAAEAFVTIDLATSWEMLLPVGFDIGEGRREDPIKTPAGRVARFDIAWVFLYEQGIKILPLNADTAINNIKRARGLYKDLAEECGDDPILGPESLYAMAVAEESLAAEFALQETQLKTAAKAYREVNTKFPNSALGREAAKRAEALGTEPVAAFYRDLGIEIGRRRGASQLPREFLDKLPPELVEKFQRQLENK